MGMNRPQELIELLKNLRNAEFRPHSEFLKTICLVDKVLETFFKIEVSNTKFNTNEKNIIGPLIADLLSTIGLWVSYSTDQLDEARLENYKIPRSGLEFLLERYQELPDGKENCLRDALEFFKDSEDVEGWDEQFKNVNSSYDPNIFYKTSDVSTLNYQEIERVPENHWWWRC